MTTIPSVDEQEAAWLKYIDLKRKADESFERFKQLYLAEDVAAGRIADRPRPDNVKIFPVHRSRPSVRVSSGGAA